MTNGISAKAVFFALIRAALCGAARDVAVDSRALRPIIEIGGRQGVLPLLFHGAKVCDCAPDVVSALKDASDRDLFDYVLRDRALTAVRSSLDGAQIPYVPLKGAVLCALYPENWMRTSGDLDVLVGEDGLERALSAIEDKTELRAKKRNYHDVSMTGGGVCLELHFSICENSPPIDGMLSRVWDYCEPCCKGSEYRMSAEYLAFHIAAHMSYHLARAGLGVRPYLDLYLIRKKTAFDESAVREMCAGCGILRFYDAAARLGEVWLDGAAHDGVTKDMERLCFHGGVFGSTRGTEAALRRENGASYLRRRVFAPKNELAESFPEVEKKPYLTPYYQMRRWGAALRRKNVAKKLRAIRETSPEQTAALERVIDALGLEV